MDGGGGLRLSRAAESVTMGNWSGIENPEGRRPFVLRKLICYVGATCRYVAAFSEFEKPPATNAQNGNKRFPFLDYVRIFPKIACHFGRWPGRGVNWNKANKARADSVTGPPCSIVAPIPGGIPCADNFGQKRDWPVRRSPPGSDSATSDEQRATPGRNVLDARRNS